MKVLLLTDIHGNVENLEKIVSRASFDTILCAGDLSDDGEFDNYEEQLEKVLDIFDESGVLTKTVPGNMDPEETCLEHLIKRRMNLHKKIAAFDGFEAVGFGGGITPFGTPFEPSGEEIKSAVSTLFKRMNSDKRVAVIHQPPKDTELDIADGNHVGDEKVRELIEETGFNLVLTGHIHESRGKDTINDCLLVNPGPAMDGYYAVAEIDDEIRVDMKQL